MEEFPSHRPGPAELSEKNELTRQVRAAIQDLPSEQREVTALFYIGDYTQNETAAFLDLPLQTVKSRLYLARKKLKERMMHMVEDAFTNQPLPEDFTRQTVEKAIQRARELNSKHQYYEAETLLRQNLPYAPQHPEML
jgi:hypothetical protein